MSRSMSNSASKRLTASSAIGEIAAAFFPRRAIGSDVGQLSTIPSRSQGAITLEAVKRFIEGGRVCLTNNAAERALRGFALGRKSWLFAERGADRAAAMTTLIMTAKLNDVDPQAWLADVLGQIADIPQGRLAELLPWNWKQPNLQAAA